MIEKFNVGVVGFVLMFFFSRLFVVRLSEDSFLEQAIFSVAFGQGNPLSAGLSTALLYLFGAFIIRLKFFPNEKKLRLIFNLILLLVILKWISDYVFVVYMTNGGGGFQWLNVVLFYLGAFLVYWKYLEKYD